MPSWQTRRTPLAPLVPGKVAGTTATSLHVVREVATPHVMGRARAVGLFWNSIEKSANSRASCAWAAARIASNPRESWCCVRSSAWAFAKPAPESGRSSCFQAAFELVLQRLWSRYETTGRVHPRRPTQISSTNLLLLQVLVFGTQTGYQGIYSRRTPHRRKKPN